MKKNYGGKSQNRGCTKIYESVDYFNENLRKTVGLPVQWNIIIRTIITCWWFVKWIDLLLK